jgi:hypothetical protein
MRQSNLYKTGFLPLEKNISQILKPIFIKGKKTKFFLAKDNFLVINNLNKNWQKVIGEKCWQFCSPKKIKFEKNKKADGVLTIAANSSAIAFYLEASTNQIIENIASYYGYKIISDIRIIQEPRILGENKSIEIYKNISQESQDLIANSTLEIKDLELKEILQKLGKSILK